MITKKEVQHIAGLARIGMSDKDIEKFSAELSAVLDWIKELEKANIEGTEPIAHITGMENITRKDEEGKFINKDKIINLFPDKKDGYGKIKSIF